MLGGTPLACLLLVMWKDLSWLIILQMISLLRLLLEQPLVRPREWIVVSSGCWLLRVVFRWLISIIVSLFSPILAVVFICPSMRQALLRRWGNWAMLQGF